LAFVRELIAISTDRPMLKHPRKYKKIHFVTGRLAEHAIRREVERVAGELGFEYSIQVMPITVAALLSSPWVAARLQVPPQTELVVLPGYCQGELEAIQSLGQFDIMRGPRDLRGLGEWFGTGVDIPKLDQWDIQIIAEINHAPQLSLQQIVDAAKRLQADGADYIDIGCDPGGRWLGVGQAVKAVSDLGIRVSIDSMNVNEIADATKAGASLVLSVNSSNRSAACDWGAEVIVIPDQPSDWESLEQSVNFLQKNQVPFRIDPILEPIGFGFANSLVRYHKARQQWPDAEMMMGIGNLTELTDVDSAGVNLLLLGVCQELQIKGILTTQVINWARTSVREIDIARRITHYSIKHQVPPKRLSGDLVMLRDPKLLQADIRTLKELASGIKDNNYRIFNIGNQVICLGDGKFWQAADPFDLFDQMITSGQSNLDASHSFYLGYEMCKAMIAGQLGKQYEQDQALNWGHLSVDEIDRHRLKQRSKKKPSHRQDEDKTR